LLIYYTYVLAWT